jgi:hypothetical protein
VIKDFSPLVGDPGKPFTVNLANNLHVIACSPVTGFVLPNLFEFCTGQKIQLSTELESLVTNFQNQLTGYRLTYSSTEPTSHPKEMVH